MQCSKQHPTRSPHRRASTARRHGQVERLGCFQIDCQLVLGRRLHRQFGRLLLRTRRSRSIAAQQGLDKKRGDFGDALDQLGNVRDKLHNSVPKGRKDSFIPFTHGLLHEALPRQTGLFIS